MGFVMGKREINCARRECILGTGICRADLYDTFISRSDDVAEIEEFHADLASGYANGRFPRLLEVGCGTGRLLAAFARTSESVVGIDLDPEYLNRATDFARENNLHNLDLRHCALAALHEDIAFDCISMINGVFYYFNSGKELVDAMAQVYAALKVGGTLVMEGGNLLFFLRHYGEGLPVETIRHVRGVSLRRRVRHEIDLCASRWIHHDTYDVVDSAGTDYSEQFSFTIFTPLALVEALEQAGFVDISVRPAWKSGAGSVSCGARLVITARRK